MPRTPARRVWAGRARAGGLCASLLLVLTGCGASEPAPLKALPPDAPADLCSTVPAATRTGLETASNTDTSGDPTAACSLRSGPNDSPQVRVVITWIQLDDDGSADSVLASQCRSIDTATYRLQSGYSAQGADKACAGSGTIDGADAASIAAVAGRAVLTVRLSSKPAGTQPSLARGTQMLEGVIASLAAGS